jgi:hypothetical protein
MTYRNAFPTFALDVAIPSGWKDSSYRNDTCPSWQTDSPVPHQRVRVFVDYADRSEREFPDEQRFNAYVENDVSGTVHWFFGSDRWEEVTQAARYLADLPDLQALGGDDVRALAGLAVAVDVPGSWYSDSSPTHAQIDRIIAVIQESVVDWVSEYCDWYAPNP